MKQREKAKRESTKASSIDCHLYPHQIRAITSKRDTVVLQGGAGAGKTYLGVVWSLLMANNYPGSAGMIISPSFSQLKQSVLVHLENIAADWGISRSWKFNRSQSDFSIKFPWGSTIFLRSADHPKSILGADLSWVWGDEAALWKLDAFRYATSRTRQAGFPHKALYTFTPKGMNWTWDELGQSTPHIEVIKATTLDNPSTGDGYKDLLKRTYGEGSQFYLQEVMGEYVAFEGLVYRMYDEKRHWVSAVPPLQEMVCVEAGLDWGWTNPGVIVVGGLDKNDCFWLLDEAYEVEKDIDWWVYKAQEMMRKWGVTVFHCDPSRPENISKFQSRGLPAVPANNAIIPGITAVSSRMMDGRFRAGPLCVCTNAEFLTYQWKKRADGTYRADEPLQVKDHAMDAVRYLVIGVQERPWHRDKRAVDALIELLK